jgi:integrase
MAAVNFLFRSTKEKAFLNIRLLFRYNDKDYVIGSKTKFEVSKTYWNKQHNQKRPKDIEIINKQPKVNQELNKIENHILNAFNIANPDAINKEWLQTQIDTYYNPPQEAKLLPNELIKYLEIYIDRRKNEITEQTIKNYSVIKQLLTRYQATNNKILLIKDVNEDFKDNFENYCLANNYAPNTTTRALRSIKTICKDAMYRGIEVSIQLDNIKPKYKKVKNIYLSFDELEKIEKIEKSKLTESLENAKDWLIISCYTGQRVSDFMRFTDEMIRIEDGKTLIEFTQKKTGKLMTVPLHKKVLELLDKRNGKFPRAISDQRYNEYIKEVCELAKINNKIKGSKSTETETDSKEYRKKEGTFKKWELVSSHIGRRSFATNFYGEIPTTYLIYITGHSTEVMFLNYIGKSNKDLALEIANYF